MAKEIRIVFARARVEKNWALNENIIHEYLREIDLPIRNDASRWMTRENCQIPIYPRRRPAMRRLPTLQYAYRVSQLTKI